MLHGFETWRLKEKRAKAFRFSVVQNKVVLRNICEPKYEQEELRMKHDLDVMHGGRVLCLAFRANNYCVSFARSSSSMFH